MEHLHDLERGETRKAIISFLTGAVPISGRELLWRRREKDSTRRLHLRRFQTATETQSAHRSLYRRQATVRDLRQTGKSKSKERLIVRNLNYHLIPFLQDLTKGEFENNLNSLNLIENVDYVMFS